MSASKQKGTAWETACVTYLRDHGFPHAERRTLMGRYDMGDINAGPGLVVECKSEKKFTLSVYVDELDEEMSNANAWTGAVWLKRPGTTNVAHGYAITPIGVYVPLLRAAGFGDPT